MFAIVVKFCSVFSCFIINAAANGGSDRHRLVDKLLLSDAILFECVIYFNDHRVTRQIPKPNTCHEFFLRGPLQFDYQSPLVFLRSKKNYVVAFAGL